MLTTSANDIPSLSLARASSARRHACSRVRVTVAGARFAPAYRTRTCFAVIRDGSEALRSRLAPAMAKHRSAALSRLDVDAGAVAEGAPPEGAAPQANVVETAMAPMRIG